MKVIPIQGKERKKKEEKVLLFRSLFGLLSPISSWKEDKGSNYRGYSFPVSPDNPRDSS